jgi:hypothetical protein
MLEALKRLISPEYLVVSEPGPLGSLWILYLILGLLFAAGLGAALWILTGAGANWRSTSRRLWAWFELWICLAGLGTVVGRFLNWPGWSARIWPFVLALLAIGGVLLYRLRRLRLPPWLAAQLHLLGFSSPVSSAKRTDTKLGYLLPTLLGLALHLAGIGLVLVTRYGQPPWVAPLVLLLLLVPQLPLLSRSRMLQVRALAPLFGAYAVTLLWLLYQALGITLIGWQGLAFPNPMISLFYIDGILLAAVVYTLLCQLHVTSVEIGNSKLLWRGAIAGLMVATSIWASVVYFGKRTHGATASDPYAYAQMGVDLAERGTFLHRFSLFQDVMPLDIAWAPLQPVGYHIPRNDSGDCPSVWATGASVLLAAGYKALGETGLYVTTPIVALLALVATWMLVHEVLRNESPAIRHLTSALTVALLATSPEHVDRLLVPMADASAQLFTILTLLFALRGTRQLSNQQRCFWSLLLAGIFFAGAYWTRHTQLVLALPVALAVLLAIRSRPGTRQPSITRLATALFLPLGTFFAAALVVALPDIVYRWQVFGGPFATETTELPLMGLQHIGPVAWQMLRDTLVAGEWGYLFPFALYGTYRLFRNRQHQALVLGSAFAAVLLVHLSYQSLRLRDLISLFPLLDLAVAYGVVQLLRTARARGRSREWPPQLGKALLPATMAAWIILSLGLSRWAMIDNLWKQGWASFGYMRVEHRAAFDHLAELTPADSVIGASLNAGAIMMYTGRDAIRPYDSWTQEEWDIFLQAMREKERPIYLLDDGGLMARFITEQEAHYALTPIAELAVPLFYTQGRGTGCLYRLEWDQ